MPMDAAALTDLLDRLIAGWENEVVEFKAASRQYDTARIGTYFSALANEANLRSVESAWLVFGVDNKRRVVCGTDYRRDAEKLQGLKNDVLNGLDPPVTFREIHELDHPLGRVVLMQIPPAPRGIPISWNGHYYARAGESLSALGVDKQDTIRNQTTATDWSAAIVSEATTEHLDPAAMARARQGFAERHSTVPAEDIAAWDDGTFLAKAKLTRDGKITRAALLLLGVDTSSHLLGPYSGQMAWRLFGEQEAYEHFGLPLLVSASALASRIRNVQMRLMPPNELIYREISKYDERSILEALYNCIAHQDYRRNARIVVAEHPDRLEFISVGEFFDGAPEDYVLGKKTPGRYRNSFLVQAMTELNLIDHIGNGIHRMVNDQIRRFLPLPDYDLESESGKVKLTIPGAVIDKAYSQLLMVRTDLPMEDVLALDRVQKGLDISERASRHLRRVGLIEGRKPHRHITAQVAAATGEMADYIRTRPQSDAHYTTLLTDYLEAEGSATRREIDALLRPLLSDALTEQQNVTKVSNLLTRLRKNGVIVNSGTRAKSRWVLSFRGDEKSELEAE